MTLMELFRVLEDDEEVEICQDDNDGGYVLFVTKPDSIPVHLLDCYVKEVRHGLNHTIIELCG